MGAIRKKTKRIRKCINLYLAILDERIKRKVKASKGEKEYLKKMLHFNKNVAL